MIAGFGTFSNQVQGPTRSTNHGLNRRMIPQSIAILSVDRTMKYCFTFASKGDVFLSNRNSPLLSTKDILLV